MQLEDRVVLVTGAGRRLGHAMAAGLAERGMTVAIHYHQSSQGAERLRASIVEAGGTADRFQADLTDPHAALELPARVVERFGRLDVLVNSAAVMKPLRFEATTPVEFDEIMNLNLRAAFFCAQAATPFLKEAGGRIVNIADVGGLEPWTSFAAHSVSKAGLIMLTRVLARALAPEVNVNAIAPGAVLLPEEWPEDAREHFEESTPLKRLGSPEDVVQALVYLLKHGDYITGETLVVDGGRLIR